MDEKGEAKMVILSIEGYQKLLLGKLQRQIKQEAEDIEKINREILKAQLAEKEVIVPELEIPKPRVVVPRVTLFNGNSSTNGQSVQRVDLREEVIDPSFDFEAPKMEFEDF